MLNSGVVVTSEVSFSPHLVKDHTLVLTGIEHGGCRDKGHEVDARSKRQHADQDQRFIADASPEHGDAEITGEENSTACCVPITHLRKEERSEENRNRKSRNALKQVKRMQPGIYFIRMQHLKAERKSLFHLTRMD